MNDTTKHIAALRGQLANLAGMKAAAKQAEANIQTAAGKRLEAVDADLKALRPHKKHSRWNAPGCNGLPLGDRAR